MDTVLKIDFPDGKSVNATTDWGTIATDQSVESGGQGAAPSPFALFLASIGTCAGYYALAFCESRGLSAADLQLDMTCRRNEAEKRFDKITLSLKVPADFPDKYHKGIIRAMDLCSVKKHLLTPPEFVMEVQKV